MVKIKKMVSKTLIPLSPMHALGLLKVAIEKLVDENDELDATINDQKEEITTLEESNAAKEAEISHLCKLVDGYKEEQATSQLLLTQYRQLYYSTMKG